MAEHTDPRKAGGGFVGPTDDPYGRGNQIVDTRHAVLMDHSAVVLVEPHRDGVHAPPACGLTLEGRINKTTERASILFLFNADGAAAIVTELVALAQRAGGDFALKFHAAVDQRLGELP